MIKIGYIITQCTDNVNNYCYCSKCYAVGELDAQNAL